MKKWLLLGMLLLGSVMGFADSSVPVVYKVDIKDDIGQGVWRLVKRSFEEADKAGADYIVIHMNTYGGTVIHADSLRTLILNYPRPVWVFIDNNAASAGALIAIACDRIYMREGASIGAATVVNQTGEAMPDKYQSYMRSMIRATAEAQGKDTIVEEGRTIVRWKRDPAIAEGMVDESLTVEGISDSGKIITLTPAEAMKYGFCDGMATSVDDVVRQEGVAEYRLESYQPTTMDKIIGFLVNPIVQGLLIMVIVGGIYFELQTPGVGFPLIAAITACVLYFAPLYIEGLANYIEIVLFGIGIILLLLEIFVIPGFGVAGVLGIVCMIASLALAGIDTVSFDFLGDFARAMVKSLFFVVSCSTISIIISIWLSSRLIGSRNLPFALYAEQKVDDGFVGVDMTPEEELGKEGVAFTDLRPAGKVEIDGEIYDAVSLFSTFIPKETRVKVVKYQSGQVYVEAMPD